MADSPCRAVVLAPPRDIVMPAYDNDATAVPVFLGCDDKFLPHAVMVIASVMAHASARNNYDIVIVESGIAQERMDRAAAWAEQFPNLTLRFIDIAPLLETVGEKLIVTKEYSAAAFFRIFAPTLFEKYDRIAYLDSDIAVLDDIAGFYRLPLDGMEAGAIRDAVTVSRSRCDEKLQQFWKDQLDKTPGEDYFFSGGLVMDLAQMRRNNTQEKLLQRMAVIKNTRLPDQDVMNAVMNGRVKMLPLEWNCLDWMCDEQEEAPNFLLVADGFLDEIRQARRNVRVVHYAEKKPWTMEYTGKNADKYWRYLQETPFCQEVLDQVRRDCNPVKLWWRRLLTRMQESHFTAKRKAVSAAEKCRYEARLRNLRWRRKGLARQTEFIRTLLRTGIVPERRETIVRERQG